MVSTVESKVRLSFENKRARHAFMMAALERSDFDYELDGVSIIMSESQRASLQDITVSTYERSYLSDEPSVGDAVRSVTHDEMVKSWDSFMNKLRNTNSMFDMN